MAHHHDVLSSQESVFGEFVWKHVTLTWFYENDTISWILEKASYDFFTIKIQWWKFSWVRVKVDLHILWDARPKVKTVQCWDEIIDLYDEDVVIQNDENGVSNVAILSAETEVKKQLVWLIKHFEDGYLNLEEIQWEISKMWLSIEMLKLVKTVNLAVVSLLIGEIQNAE